MGNFKRRENSDRGPKNFSGKKFGGRSFGGGNKSYGDRDSSRGSSLYQAVCATCGQDCEVPFRPNGKKPVFCSICFDKQGGSDKPKFGEKSFDRPRFANDRKPEFHREAPARDNKDVEQLKSQFADMSAKLDKVLYLLSTLTEKKSETVEAVEFESSEEKPAFKMKKKVDGAKKKISKKK